MRSSFRLRPAGKALVVSIGLIILVVTLVHQVNAQTEDPVLVLEDMDADLIIGQRAVSDWGHFWSAPAVTGINLGYLAGHGYPEFVSDSNGNGNIDSEDLVSLVSTLGGEDYMKTEPDRGTSDPDLLRGIAEYVDEKYPDTFKLKVYEDKFTNEYVDVTGESLPEELSGVPVSLFGDPEFSDYERELRDGEMVWIGVPQDETDLNHYLAGRSFDTRENLSGNFPVDFGEPRERSFQPGKGQIIETEMTGDGVLNYDGSMRPVDIMIALSPVGQSAGPADTDKPDLRCRLDCELVTKDVCVQKEVRGQECREECTGQYYPTDDYCTGEWETVCEGGEEVCVERATDEVVTCEVIVENVGGSESYFSTGKVELARNGNVAEQRQFGVTGIGPGEQGQATKLDINAENLESYEITCSTDIYDANDEANEDNNTTELGDS